MDPTTVTPTAQPTAPAAASPASPGVTVGEDRLKARNAEVLEIVALCNTYGLQAKSAEYLSAGTSLSEVRADVLKQLGTRSEGGRFVPGELLEGLSRKDRKRYSYARVLRHALETRNAGELDGVEGEVHRQMERNRPKEMASNGGFIVPLDTRTEEEILAAEERRLQHRVTAANAPGKGMELIGEARMELVEALFAQAVGPQLGVNVNTGLTMPLSYPRVTNEPTTRFVGENPSSDATEDDLVTGEILSGPKPMIGAVPLTRGLILQTGGGAEAYARKRLAEGPSLAMDRALFAGTGTGSQPTGLYFTPAVLTEAMGGVAPTYIKITSMIGKVADQNAAYGSLGFVTTPLLAAFLMGKEEFSATGRPIWTGTVEDGRVAGYRAKASTQMSKVLGAGADEHGFGFGNWAEVDVNQWGGVEVLVDPYTGALRGLVKLRTYGFGDVVFKYPHGMCVATAAKPA